MAHNAFAGMEADRVEALRWSLRDIQAKRLKLFPVSEEDLSELVDLGLIELRADSPVLTRTGMRLIG